MARIRSIKPEFWTSPDVGDVSRDARLTFIGLWNLADDAGRLEVVPARLHGELFPFDLDVSVEDVCGWLNELSRQGLVSLYAAGRRCYLTITGWDAHQRIDNPSNPRCPDPDDCRHIDSVSPTIAADLGRVDAPSLFAEPSRDPSETLARPSPPERRSVGALEHGSVGSSLPPDGGDEDDAFEEFWQAYPRHRENDKLGGGAAKAKTRKLWDKLDADEREPCLIGARHYGADCVRRDAPPKHATTFLNERHWEDWQEPATPTARGQPHDAGEADRHNPEAWTWEGVT